MVNLAQVVFVDGGHQPSAMLMASARLPLPGMDTLVLQPAFQSSVRIGRASGDGLRASRSR
jgi:hypothetical protein